MGTRDPGLRPGLVEAAFQAEEEIVRTYFPNDKVRHSPSLKGSFRQPRPKAWETVVTQPSALKGPFISIQWMNDPFRVALCDGNPCPGGSGLSGRGEVGV
jgi:hypothetical protein